MPGYPAQPPAPQGYPQQPPPGQAYPPPQGQPPQPPPGQGYPLPQGQGPYGPRQPQGIPPQGRPAYPQAPWQPPRQRSGGGAAVVVGSVFGVIALVFVGLVVVGAIIKSNHRMEPMSPIAFPTYTPQTPYDPPTSRPSYLETAEPTPTASESPSPEQTSTVAPPRQQVLNTTLENNTVYRAGALPKVSCPVGSPSIYSHSQLKALILKTSRCLDKGWSEILRKEGIAWHRPGYAITAGKGRGACGDFPSIGSTVPYYCPRNTTIYASTGAMSKGVGNAVGYGQIVSWHGAIISMMAHEYGHHVQQLSGLSETRWQRSERSSSTSGKLTLSRKFELQATCFGGMFMRSVSATYPVTPAKRNTLYYFYTRVGDWPGYPRDHGSLANNNRWFRQGYEKNKVFQCNTWLAPSSTTS
ncbi:neutral zinc metallopeptidase [Streptosporangium sp. NPDC051023]|uniref:neutral zinc metallopeptidase n=1 Tax=Streptosporangium sp. NPDC051023 TaxID=3155410 RepID=UPI00344CF784